MFYAFNHCGSVQYKKYLAGDLEFYQDLGGLHFLPEEMQSAKEMCDILIYKRFKLSGND